MTSNASSSPGPWHRFDDQSYKKNIRKWSKPLRPIPTRHRKRREPKLVFQTQPSTSYSNLGDINQVKKPGKEYTIPLHIAMAGSPVINRDFDCVDLTNGQDFIALLNHHNSNAISLFLQYICRHHPRHAAKFPISETYPKMLLWCQTYQLAKHFEIMGLQKLLVKRIKWKLFEFEDSGMLSREYMQVIELVDVEEGCWEWLRQVVVDVKWMLARERRERGISVLDELPDCERGWGGPPLLYNSDCSGDSVDAEM